MLEILGLFVVEILRTIWFFARPVVYLYLVWVSINIAELFH